MEKAAQLAHALPPAASKQELIDMIENRRQMLAVISADFLGMLEREFGSMFGEEDDEGEWDQEEWDEAEDHGGFFMPPPLGRHRGKQRKGR